MQFGDVVKAGYAITRIASVIDGQPANNSDPVSSESNHSISSLVLLTWVVGRCMDMTLHNYNPACAGWDNKSYWW